MAYIGNGPGVASQRVLTTITAVDGQTTFVPSSGYTLGYVDVFLNGVKLVDGTDYTASNGVNIVLAEAAVLNDTVEVLTYFPRGLSDGYTKAEADGRYEPIDTAYTKAETDARYVEVAGDTMTGDLTVGTVTMGGLLVNKSAATSALSLEAKAPTNFSVGSGFYSDEGQSTIEFKDSNTTANYKVRVGSETDDMVFFAGGSERLRISSGGNLRQPWSNSTYTFGPSVRSSNAFVASFDSLVIAGADAVTGSQAMAGGNVVIRGGHGHTNTNTNSYAGSVTIAGGEKLGGGTAGTGVVKVNTSGVERMRVSSEGYVTKAHQPRGVMYTYNSLGAMPAGQGVIPFQSTASLTTGVSATTGSGAKFTVPVDGTYLVTVNMGITSTANGTSIGDGIFLVFLVNGAIPYHRYGNPIFNQGAITGEENAISNSILLELSANDYVQAAFNDVSTSYSNVNGGNFSIYLMG